jgi:DNA-binding protein H-NS
MKQTELRSMSTEALWTLHESVVKMLTVKITAEKRELDKRLHQINMVSHVRLADGEGSGHERRPYPRVLPKYRNPLQPLEMWSGRGKKPRWMTKQLKSGRRMDEFRIGQDELCKLQGSPTLVP